MTVSSEPAARMGARAWGVLVVLSGAIFLEGIDVAMVNVALPAIRADLGLGTGELSGVVSAYVLGYAGFIPLGGRVADLLGRRRMFLVGLAVLVVFSALGGLAGAGWTLLVARFATGVAAAFLTPAGHVDVAGALSITAAMLLLAHGVVRLEDPTGAVGATVAVFAVGLALVVVFVLVELRSPAPLVRLGLLRTPGLVRTDLTALLFLGAFAGFQFLVSLYLQELRGWTPTQTALAMLVIAVDTVLAPTLTTSLVGRFGVPPLVLAGLVAGAAAYALFLPVGPDWLYLLMLSAFGLLGLSFAPTYGPLTMAATDSVDEDEHGVAGGLLYPAMQFGSALGLSAVTAVHVAASAGAPGLDAVRTALVVPLVAALLGVVVVLGGRPLARRRRSSE